METLKEIAQVELGYDTGFNHSYYVHDRIQGTFTWFDSYSQADNYYEQLRGKYNHAIWQ